LHVSAAYSYASVEAAMEAVFSCGTEIEAHGLSPTLCPFIVAFTSNGDVSQAAQKILKILPNREIAVDDVLKLKSKGYDNNIIYWCVCTQEHIARHKKGLVFHKEHYYAHPEEYEGIFHERILPEISVLVNGMFWKPAFPKLITNEQIQKLHKEKRLRLEAIAELACDVKGPIEFFVRSTPISNPVYFINLSEIDSPGYLSGIEKTEQQASFDEKGIMIYGVDHIPAEFALQSSLHFGDCLVPYVAEIAYSDMTKSPEQMNLRKEILAAMETSNGSLTEPYKYLSTPLAIYGGKSGDPEDNADDHS